jgi:acrylyl-CoA reductase (NADPH)
MALGTAGYTAMLCVLALERHGLKPGDGEVLVTGATGGVGSVATALLAKLGHAVTCATGKAERGRLPDRLGARHVIDRAELVAAGKPLQKERWAAVVDAVGSHTLVNALAQTRYGGVVAGLRAGAGQRPAGHRAAVHPARRHAGRHRQRDGADRPAPRGMGAARP